MQSGGKWIICTKLQPGTGIFKGSTKTSPMSDCTDYRVGGEVKNLFTTGALGNPLLHFFFFFLFFASKLRPGDKEELASPHGVKSGGGEIIPSSGGRILWKPRGAEGIEHSSLQNKLQNKKWEVHRGRGRRRRWAWRKEQGPITEGLSNTFRSFNFVLRAMPLGSPQIALATGRQQTGKRWAALHYNTSRTQPGYA